MRRRLLLSTLAAGLSGCLRSQTPATETATAASDGALELRLDFNDTVTESDINDETTGDRELAFMCFSISVWGENGRQLASYDIGGAEDGIVLTSGYYAPPETSDDTFRWFGGPDAATTFRIGPFGEGTPQHITLVGTPVVDNEISATLAVDDRETDSVEFGQRGAPEPYEFSLAQSTA